MSRVKQRRGIHANLPSSGMEAGELLLTTDLHTIHFALDGTNKATLVPAVNELASIPSISGAADLLMIWDDSEAAAPKAKKVTFDTFKTALNIPAGSTDELAAVVAGGTAGYIWGTDGSDGVIRMGSSMSWTKDAGDGFVSLSVNVVDCGTF